ncbi:hypothetical protein PHYPSEUDO_005963 [Phytophthora pseudosyringae]|uniref:RxLR effector protein n=1 Tax=Phytophthora pseudosyringae TaxID=221518 RepID=A0A8T1VKP3_9STRA|nr:hypothetical protein PHYPSEUDO_005963 [Phytophthora pseudosyringae]
MRSIFYVALALAVVARSTVVAAFANADESQLLSKTFPDGAADAVISSDSRKRFLRVTDPDLAVDDEERGGQKYGSMTAIIAKLEEQNMKHVAKILSGFEAKHYDAKLMKAVQDGKISKNEMGAVKALLGI